SIGSQVMHMLTVMIVGLAMGATVTIGQAVGARDRRGAAGYIGNTTTLFLALSVVVTGVLLALARPIAAVMSTPAEAVPGTVAYLRICFLGVPLITAYNIIASIFRGLGDSKRPMYFIAIACAANIALDYLFMICWISVAERLDWSASLLICSATTAKPLPASPALAASMLA
ncbi:Multi antimicrobial extrusion protein MatE, partial [human gut metagenome]